jgi:hypothetical protein
MMSFWLRWALIVCLGTSHGLGHDEPTSFLNIELTEGGATLSFVASATDLSQSLPEVEPAMLLQEPVLRQQADTLAATFRERLTLAGDDHAIALAVTGAVPIPTPKDVELRFACAWTKVPRQLRIEGLPFPYDPRHRTFVSVQQQGGQAATAVLSAEAATTTILLAEPPSIMATVMTFIREGVHHIFIGPDHILFVVALLLLGGTLRRLLAIVTAFTIAHSITLILAVAGIVTPSARIIEPVIALSIVFTGAHAFFAPGGRDPRVLMAFVFGLVHGFGFAFVLQELVLPLATRGWALFAFNVGVELGQAAIVLAVAPLLGFLRSQNAMVSHRVTTVLALGVTAMGALWFFERISGG